MIVQAFKYTFCLFLIGILFGSCVAHKEMILMQENEDILKNLRSNSKLRDDRLNKPDTYRINVYDQLMIRINSFDGNTDEFLSREFGGNNTGNNNNFDPATTYFSSYEVHEAGVITLPIIGNVKVLDLTTVEIKNKLSEAYSTHMKYPSVRVKVANKRLTVTGEVNKPGQYYLYNEENTFLDAVGMAGDFTAFADLKQIKLIRQTEQGSKTIFLDLSSPEFVFSDYYYVQPGDFLYVQPLKAKSLDTSSNSLGVVLSAVSIGVLLANIFINNK